MLNAAVTTFTSNHHPSVPRMLPASIRPSFKILCATYPGSCWQPSIWSDSRPINLSCVAISNYGSDMIKKKFLEARHSWLSIAMVQVLERGSPWPAGWEMPFQLGELVQMPSVAQILCRILCSVSINETIQASSSSEPCLFSLISH